MSDFEPTPRFGRIVGLLAAAALGVGGIYWGALQLGGGRRDRPHEPAQEIDNSTYLSPLKATAAGRGEEVAPFQGFAVSVETEPPGAVVTIAGVPRGEAPVLANVDCKPGSPLEIRAELAGAKPAVHRTACRQDALLKVTLRLGR